VAIVLEAAAPSGAPEMAEAAEAARTVLDRIGMRGASEPANAMETLRMAWGIERTLAKHTVAETIVLAADDRAQQQQQQQQQDGMMSPSSSAAAAGTTSETMSNPPTNTSTAAAATVRDFEEMLVALHTRLRPVNNGNNNVPGAHEAPTAVNPVQDMLSHAIAALKPVRRPST